MSKLVEDVNRMAKEIEVKKQELVDLLKPQFQEMFLPFLVKYPFIKGFKWTQYAPYFNDGEPCTFSVNELIILPKGKKRSEDEEEDASEDSCYSDYLEVPDAKSSEYRKEAYAEEKKKYDHLCDFSVFMQERKGLNEAFTSIPHDTMRELFGDDGEVTVTKKGIEVEHYEHD